MVNEKRVRRMARMAAYEAADGVRDRKIMSYFRGDYLMRQALITFFCSTLAFVLLAIVYVVYHFETLIVEIYTMDLRVILMQVLTGYLVFLGVMIVLTLAVYSRRYTMAKKHIAGYYHDLGILAADLRESDGQRTEKMG